MGLSPPFHKFFTEVHKRACGLLIYPRTHTIPWFKIPISGPDPTPRDLYLWMTDPAPDPDQWPSRHEPKQSFLVFCLLLLVEGIFTSFFKDRKVNRSHKTVEIKVFLTIFAWWWKVPDPKPDPYFRLTDPGGPKILQVLRIRIRNSDKYRGVSNVLVQVPNQKVYV